MIKYFKLIIVIVSLFIIISCSPKPIIDGEQVTSPYGYTDFCKTNSESIFCKEVKY